MRLKFAYFIMTVFCAGQSVRTRWRSHHPSDVLKARKQRRRGLFAKLRERSKTIDQLLEIKRNDSAESDEHPATEQIEKKPAQDRA